VITCYHSDTYIYQQSSKHVVYFDVNALEIYSRISFGYFWSLTFEVRECPFSIFLKWDAIFSERKNPTYVCFESGHNLGFSSTRNLQRLGSRTLRAPGSSRERVARIMSFPSVFCPDLTVNVVDFTASSTFLFHVCRCLTPIIAYLCRLLQYLHHAHTDVSAE
jgi:hypothetical protein